MPRKHKVAVIGCGYWGPNLIRNFNALPDCEMSLICEQDDDRIAHMKSLYPHLESVKSVEEVAAREDIDVVAIATPLTTHHKLAKACLDSGKHVFIEKPMAASTEECRDLLAAADKRNLTLMVGHTFVYTPAVRYMKEIIDSGELGDVYYIAARRLNLGLFQRDINVAWDLAPHDISIILYLLDEMPRGVNCQGQSHMNGHEDVTNMSLDFPNGRFATIQSSWLDPNKIREMTIVGSKGMLVYNDVAQNEKIRLYDKRVEAPPHYDTFAEFQFSYHYGDMRAPYIRQLEPLRVECQHFFDCIDNGCKPDSSGIEGMQVVQILEASSDSLRQKGGRIEIGHEVPVKAAV